MKIHPRLHSMMILVSLSASLAGHTLWCDAKFLSSLASLLLSQPFTLSGKFTLEPSHFLLLPWLYLPRRFIEADLELESIALLLTKLETSLSRQSFLSSHIA